MINQLNPLYKYLFGSPILLRLACVVTSWTSSEVYKVNNNGLENSRTLPFIKQMILLTFSFVAWISHIFFSHFPGLKIGKGSSTVSKSTQCLDNAMQRALCQVFALVNDTPVSSEKYEFARMLVDKIIVENVAHGDETLSDANKLALEAAFSRTLDMLALALELKQQQEIKGDSWSWTLLRSVFPGGLAGLSQNAFSLESICMCIYNFVFPVAKPRRFSVELLSLMTVSTGSSMSAVAEKLAQELLWIAEKLNKFASIDEAVRKLSSFSHLAKLSISAHPRVQASLLRMFVLVFNDLAVRETHSLNSNLKANLLLLWLPLFCHAKSGIDFPSFTPSEKSRILKSLEQNIYSLSVCDQERVLACWLKEYVSSPSEWPNLQHCYENWCHYIRKSRHAGY